MGPCSLLRRGVQNGTLLGKTFFRFPRLRSLARLPSAPHTRTLAPHTRPRAPHSLQPIGFVEQPPQTRARALGDLAVLLLRPAEALTELLGAHLQPDLAGQDQAL